MSEPVVLMAEDNAADVFFFREAVEASQIKAETFVVEDGSDALRFLYRKPPYNDAPRPDVLVLDLNLPLRNGREVLEEMAADSGLRSIPVAILTISTAERHLCRAYPGPCLYFVKTDDFLSLQAIVREIMQHGVLKSAGDPGRQTLRRP